MAGLVLLLAFMLFLLGGLTIAQAQEKTLYWERYDVNLTVEPNSDILVEEIQQIAFTSGTFTFGFAAIPLVDRVRRYYRPGSIGTYRWQRAALHA